MKLTIELPDTLAGPLKAEAMEQGVSPDRYVSRVIERALSTPSHEPLASGEGSAMPFWEMIKDRMKNVPSEVFERLPQDGAAEHDHYIYGTPKKYP